MKLFGCGRCGQVLFFDNLRCLRCGADLGVSADDLALLTLVRDGDCLVPAPPAAPGRAWRRCANEVIAACNWLVPAERPGLCLSCRLTRTRPNDADAAGLRALERAESAKRHLVFQLLRLGLPVVPRAEDPAGLAFDLLWAPGRGVVTGHEDGVVTLDLTESDDARRERLRVELDEPYRTLLGHLRHEVGHYYWGELAAAADLARFRDLFGDERADYRTAMDRHYAAGPPVGWQDDYVSAYAAMHPFEDWAETFAHLLHLDDVLDTAAGAGITVAVPTSGGAGVPALTSHPADALARGDFQALLDAWIPLSLGLNAVSRSMGKTDLYPFVLAPRVMDKLRFVHDRIAGRRP